jgi:hypothetical protein
MNRPSLYEFVTDPQLLGLTVSPAQRSLLKAMEGNGLDGEEMELWTACTGRAEYPAIRFGEVTVIAGARAGKDSRIAAPTLCYEAAFGQHERYLAKGEKGVLPLVAQDQRATRVAFGYIRDYFLGSPVLRDLLDGEPQAGELKLTNGQSVLCFPCTLRSLRGFSIPVGIMDELAYYRLEGSADSDVEVQASIRRGMLNFPDPRLVKISTPYLKGGVLFEDFMRAFGQDDPDLLVWKAATMLMNPSVTAKRLEREQRLDPVRFAREFLGEFAEDVSAFLPAVWIDEAAVAGRHELPPMAGVTYHATSDPSGGGGDAFTVSIQHVEGEGEERRLVQDVMRGWGRVHGQAPDLKRVVREIVALCKRYGVTMIVGDRYSASWVSQTFQSAGLMYRPTELDKARAYAEAEPFFAQGRVVLLDHPLMARELKTLERRTRAGGRDVIDHPRGGHDDYANVICLGVALAELASDAHDLGISLGEWSGDRRELARGYRADDERPPKHPDDIAWEAEQATAKAAEAARGWAAVPESRGGIPTGQPIERKPIPRDAKALPKGPLELIVDGED